MHTFRKMPSGRYEVGTLSSYNGCFVPLLQVDRLAAAVKAVNYLNGGSSGRGFVVYAAGDDNPITIIE